MKKIVFFLFLYTGTLPSQTIDLQNIKVDSILKIIDFSEKASSKKEKNSLLHKAIEMAASSKQDSVLIEPLYSLGKKGVFKNDTIGYAFHLKKLLNVFEKTKNYKAYGLYFKLKGLFFAENGKLYSAYLNYKKAKNIFIKNGYLDQVSYCYIDIMITQHKAKDRIGIKQTAIEAQEFFKTHKNHHALILVYINLSSSLGVYNLENGIQYYKKAIFHTDSIKDPRIKFDCILSAKVQLGELYTIHKKYKEALPILEEALELYKTSEYKHHFIDKYAQIILGIGNCQIGLGNKEKGISQLKKALYLSKINNLELPKLYIIKSLSIFYSKELQNKKAIFYGEKALKLSKKVNNKEEQIEILYLLARLYSGKKTETYYKVLLDLKDSLSNKQQKTKEHFALQRFKTEQKEEENAHLTRLNRINKNKIKSEKQKGSITLLIAVVSILFSLFSYTFYTQKKRTAQYRTNLEKAKARDQERSEIAISLHDKVAGDLAVLYERALKNSTKEIFLPLLKIKNEIRNISHKLSSVDFDEVSFKDQIINLISDYYSNLFKVKVLGLEKIAWDKVENEIKRTLYLVIRESLQNSKTHAKATEVSIDFKKNRKYLQLEIKDNGDGFDITSPNLGLGLKSQQKRIEQLNGFYDLQSALNIGTITLIKIPIKA